MSRFLTNVVSKITAQTKSFKDLETDAVEIGSQDLYKFFNGLNLKFQPSGFVYLSDVDYYLLDKALLKSILRSDGTDRYVYRKEGGDCDNFAKVLLGRINEMEILCDLKRGTAFGYVSGLIYLPDKPEPVSHAMNCFIYKDKKSGDLKFKLIEPQSDKFIDHDERNLYKLILI